MSDPKLLAAVCLFLSPLFASPIGAQATPAPAHTLDVYSGAAKSSATALDFGPLVVGAGAVDLPLLLSNQSPAPIPISQLELKGPDATAFALSSAGSQGFTLAPGTSRRLTVSAAAAAKGSLEAELVVHYGRGRQKVAVPTVDLRAVGIGSPGQEVLMNAGGTQYLDGAGQTWSPPFGVLGLPQSVRTTDPIAGTLEDDLFATQHRGPLLSYALPLPSGVYDLSLHFCEIEHSGDLQRLLNVQAEGAWVLLGLDVHAEVGHDAAHTETFRTVVSGGALELGIFAAQGEAMLSALEVRAAPQLVADIHELAFGAVGLYGLVQKGLTLENPGSVPIQINELSLIEGQAGSPAAFEVNVAGVDYGGTSGSSSHLLHLSLAPGETLPVTVEYSPTEEQLDLWTLAFRGVYGTLELPVSGLGGHTGHPFLHPVIEAEQLVVDYDGDGSAELPCDGSLSHTHEPAHALTAHTWLVDQAPVATGPLATLSLGLGQHQLSLEIHDDNTPPDSTAVTIPVEAVPVTAVPGIAVHYYESGAGGAASLLDSVPFQADFAELRPSLGFPVAATVGGSPYTGNVLVQARANLHLATAGNFSLTVFGGGGQRLEVDGQPWTSPGFLAAGLHALEVRWAVDGLGQLPLDLHIAQGGGAPAPIAEMDLTHNESGLLPVINAMPVLGSTLGGETIQIDGLGFFPMQSVQVHWGPTVLSGADLISVDPDRIRLISPAGTGIVTVRVKTDQGYSNSRAFEYDSAAPVPLIFENVSSLAMPEPICGDWGPDGRFYIGRRSGEIVAISLDKHDNISGWVTYPGVSGLSNSTILGLAFDPWHQDSPVELYVAHNELFAQGGAAFSGPAPYPGAVSRLSGPNFDSPVPVISNLPVSNHDHAVNGLVFDNNGDLLLSVGSNTNAGIPHPNSGDLPETPLSAAILKAELSRTDFNGDLHYVDSATGLPNEDQVFGEQVDLAPGTHVQVHAGGVRNSLDMVYTTGGKLYATDNGPNWGYGAASTGATTQAPNDPNGLDELLLVEAGNYYGHPNRSRGRYDEREYVYHGHVGPSIPEVFSQALTTLSPSSNGIVEYRAETFGGQLRGDLIAQRWISYMRRIQLSPDGRRVVGDEDLFPWTGALGLRTGPGGSLLVLDQLGNMFKVLRPKDLSASGLKAFDITPWRAPATGGMPFVIAGQGFGDLTATSVTIGGLPATLLAVNDQRIVGWVPTHASPPAALVDVIVQVGAEASILPGAFRFLLPKGTEPGSWESLSDLPDPLGEVAAGVVDGILYAVGEGTAKTYAYDIEQKAWDDSLALRPFGGHHHGCEVLGGKLYLIGGLGGGSEGKLQIYDPASDSWSLGAELPWAGGSISTALIEGRIYAAGGIVGFTTVDNCAVYDPTTNSWSARTPMPAGKGRNHAAAGTDGRRLYVFGGRGVGSGPGNWVANGFDDVQIYDSLSDSWQASFDPGSTLAPLPQRRGGTGKAVWWQDEFYVFGGETLDDPGATADGVFARVDVYDPLTNTWRLEAPMPAPRHGIFPVLYQSRMFLPAGGWKAAFSGTSVLDAFTRQ